MTLPAPIVATHANGWSLVGTCSFRIANRARLKPLLLLSQAQPGSHTHDAGLL
jgi:hypothetical protein